MTAFGYVIVLQKMITKYVHVHLLDLISCCNSFRTIIYTFFMRYLIQRAKSIGHIDTLADFNEKSHDLLTYHPYLSKIKDPVNKQFM